MLCDRCASNADCEHFIPKSQCLLERQAFEKVVSDLVEEFDLDNVADKILVERAAMYLIRITRAEAYEAAVGVTEKSALWGAYISRLDNVLRGLFNDLAMTRGKRKQLEKGEALLVSLDEILKKFAKIEQKSPKIRELDVERRRVVFAQRKALLVKWKREYPKLRLTIRRRVTIGKEKTENS
jgi:hypothetical protein